METERGSLLMAGIPFLFEIFYYCAACEVLF